MSAETKEPKTERRGGLRSPCGGRPRKADAYGRPVADAERVICDRLPELRDALFDLALGVTVQEDGQDGKPRVYRRPPDRAAAEYLWNRVGGKPVDRMEMQAQEPEKEVRVTIVRVPPRKAADDEAED